MFTQFYLEYRKEPFNLFFGKDRAIDKKLKDIKRRRVDWKLNSVNI